MDTFQEIAGGELWLGYLGWFLPIFKPIPVSVALANISPVSSLACVLNSRMEKSLVETA